LSSASSIGHGAFIRPLKSLGNWAGGFAWQTGQSEAESFQTSQ
jgi:hypothetical protein